MPHRHAALEGADRRRVNQPAVVTPGTEVPPGSVVGGIPAKVLRPATDDDLAHIRGNAASYTERLASARKVRPVVRRPLPPAGAVPGDYMS